MVSGNICSYVADLATVGVIFCAQKAWETRLLDCQYKILQRNRSWASQIHWDIQSKPTGYFPCATHERVLQNAYYGWTSGHDGC